MKTAGIFEHGTDLVAFDYYEVEPLTAEVIKEVQQQFNVTLPKAYIELMSLQNGGSLSDAKNTYYVNVENSDEQEVIGVSHLYGISMDDTAIGGTFYMIEEWEYPENIIIISDEAHYAVCLDYRNYAGDNPPIRYIDLELELDIEIAPDFETFIENLTNYVDEDEDENEDDYDYEDDEDEVISQEAFETLIKEDKENIGIQNGFYYFEHHEAPMDWFIKQLNFAVQSKHEEVADQVAQSVILLLKKHIKTGVLTGYFSEIHTIAEMIERNEGPDANHYKTRVNGFLRAAEAK